MKTHSIIAALLIFFCFSVKGQKDTSMSQIEKFTGIGIFKIGADTSTICAYAKSVNRTISPLSDGDWYASNKTNNDENEVLNVESDKSVYRFRKDKFTWKSLYTNNCPDVTEYFINEYTVSEIHIYNIRLVFYKNKLVKFSSNKSKSISDAMKSKYGDPVLTTEKKEINCLYNSTGNVVANEDVTYFENWSNGDIKATSILHKFYDDQCNVHYFNQFSYQVIDDDYKNCTILHYKDYIEQDNDKNKLNDF
jgi:hypothetical protein